MIKWSIQNNKIVFGLSHIKQVGDSDSAVIMKYRPSKFTDFIRLHFNTEGEKLRSLAVESLIGCGACDAYGLSRAAMMSVYLMLKELTPKEIEFIFANTPSGADTKELIDVVYRCANEKSIKKWYKQYRMCY